MTAKLRLKSHEMLKNIKFDEVDTKQLTVVIQLDLNRSRDDAVMAQGKNESKDEGYKGLKPDTLSWWNYRVDRLIAEQRGSDALALTDEFLITKPKKRPKN